MKKIVAFLSAVMLFCTMSFSSFAYDMRSDITNKTLNKILDDYKAGVKNGDSYVSLEKYGISGEDAYSDLSALFLFANGDVGSITIGKYSETYLNNLIEMDSDGTIKGVKLQYNERYLKSDGTCDLELVKQDQKLVTERYNYAKSLVDYSMSAAEKALVLYEFIISATNYPTDDEIAVGGNDIYTFVGILRDGKALCTAYAKLYAILLNDCGIPAITVDSNMNHHEWVMLKIDGKWYHADPTWDDYSFFDGYTIMWDLNNDYWDIGAVNRNYFLKSDEEFMELSHMDWQITGSVNPSKLTDPPTANNSDAFNDKFFSDKNSDYLCYTNMNYINGSWYFVDVFSDCVVRATYSGDAEYIKFPDNEIPKYSYGYENELYINTDNYLYRYDTISGNLSRIMAIPAEKQDTDNFSEMRVLYDNMTLISASYTFNSSGEYEDAEFTVNEYPMAEIAAMKTIDDDFSYSTDEVNDITNEENTAPTTRRLTRPGGNTDNNRLTSEQRAALEMATVTGTRVSAIFFIIISAVFIILAIAAVIHAIKNGK